MNPHRKKADRKSNLLTTNMAEQTGVIMSGRRTFMKALRKIHEGSDGIQLFQDMPIPEPASEEIRIKIIYASICGTDLHIRNDEFPVQMPVTIGHEYSGIDRKSTRLNSSHRHTSRMPSSA